MDGTDLTNVLMWLADAIECRGVPARCVGNVATKFHFRNDLYRFHRAVAPVVPINVTVPKSGRMKTVAKSATEGNRYFDAANRAVLLISEIADLYGDRPPFDIVFDSSPDPIEVRAARAARIAHAEATLLDWPRRLRDAAMRLHRADPGIASARPPSQRWSEPRSLLRLAEACGIECSGRVDRPVRRFLVRVGVRLHPGRKRLYQLRLDTPERLREVFDFYAGTFEASPDRVRTRKCRRSWPFTFEHFRERLVAIPVDAHCHGRPRRSLPALPPQYAAARAHAAAGVSKREVARRIGRSPAWVVKALRGVEGGRPGTVSPAWRDHFRQRLATKPAATLDEHRRALLQTFGRAPAISTLWRAKRELAAQR